MAVSEAELYRFMSACRLGVLGSLHNSMPQVALVGIAVTPQLEIVFDTVSTSRKYRNLLGNPACSFVLGWAGEQTVQYEGEARQLDAPEWAPYLDIYLRVWPDGAGHMQWPGIAYFLVRPKWIRYSDYYQRPPLIQEFTF